MLYSEEVDLKFFVMIQYKTLCHKSLHCIHGFKKKSNIFIFLTMIKIVTNYAKTSRILVGRLEQLFNKFHLFKISEILIILF